MNTKNIALGAVAVIVVAGVSFWGGTHFRAQASNANYKFMAGANGATFSRGSRTMGGFTTGRIVSTSPTSITLQTPSGSSMIVFLASSTPILTSAKGSPSDLTTGTTIMVTGTSNSDGSLTAQSIQIRPAGTEPRQPAAQ